MTTYSQRRLFTCAAAGCILAAATLTLNAAFVQNPSFESNWNPAYPHYGSIDNWIGGTGVNDRSLDRGGPFHDNGKIPDGNRVAFKQQGGDLSQTISGLTIGQLYWVQFYYNTRGDVLTGTCDITTSFNGNTIDSITGIQRVTAPEGSGPITVPFYSRTVPFVADTDTGTLNFHVNTVGDRTALFDAVTIVPRGSNDVTIMNPSFEASGTIPGVGPITNAMAGWAGTGVYGVDTASGIYADNGTIPDQDLVAFIQGPGSLSQTISKLVPGTKYQLMFAYNASSSSSSPHLQVKADSAILFEADVAQVGAANLFHTNLTTFTASSNQFVLSFIQSKSSAETVLIDDVRLLGQTAVALPPMQVTPTDAELAPGQSVTLTLVVPAEKLALGPADIVVSSSDATIAKLVGADTNGNVNVHYDKNGVTTKTVKAVAVNRGTASVNVTDSAGLIVPNGVLIHVVTSFVRNPSFEAQAAPSGIGVGPVLAWDGTGTFGVNHIEQAFAANSGPIPDRLQVAFIQGVGSLSQQVTGLTPGANYWLQFCYALRDIPDPLGPATDLVVKFGGQTLVTIPHIIPLSQAGAGAYYFTNVIFAPTNTSGTLAFNTANPKGDATLLLDAINIIRREPDEIVMQNPSFEASGAMDLYIEGPNTAPLFGWTITGGGRGTAASGPFYDNGLTSDQDEVLFLQGADTASQVVSGFTAGQTYTIIYSVNSRGCCGSPLTTHYAIQEGPPNSPVTLFEEDINPVGGTALFYRRYATFTADGTDEQVEFQHMPTDDKTLMIDNVRILPGAVGAAPNLAISYLAGGTIQLTWPAPAVGYVLQSSASPSGPWTGDGAAITTQGPQRVAVVQPTKAARYYRLTL
jgi:hypothetical protein